MKKVLAIVALFAVMAFGISTVVAQDSTATAETAQLDSVATPAPADDAVVEEVVAEEGGIHKALKTKFIEGGAGFMASVTFCLIFGLALAIERIIYLTLSSTNTKKLLAEVEKAINEGGVDAAMEVCRNTRGPVASIFYQGLSRYDEGIEVVEKTVASYGGVQLGNLEKNLSWIGLFIGLAPMLGFMGTVIGMIEAFDKIQQVGDISATVVAGGIKVALLTTLLGLIVAVILQIFYTLVLSKIEDLVNDMEDSSISLLDIIVKYNKDNK
jgi:biopolymer transport protein ExbB